MFCNSDYYEFKIFVIINNDWILEHDIGIKYIHFIYL